MQEAVKEAEEEDVLMLDVVDASIKVDAVRLLVQSEHLYAVVTGKVKRIAISCTSPIRNQEATSTSLTVQVSKFPSASIRKSAPGSFDLRFLRPPSLPCGVRLLEYE